MLKKLRERLAKLATDMRAMHKAAEDEDRGFSVEERESWDAMLAEFEEVEERIKAAEQAERLAKTAVGPDAIPNLDDDETGERAAPQTHLEHRASPEYEAAYDTFLRANRALEAPERELLVAHQAEMQVRAQGIATDAAGGYTVPEGFAGFITERMVDFSGLYGAANPGGNRGPTLLRTASGNLIPFPTNDDTGNVGELLAENTSAAELDTVFGARNLTAYIYSSKLIRVSLQLLQDEAVNLQAYLANILGKRLGRVVAPHFAQGTGSGQPTGLATAATDGAVDISTAAGVTWQDLIDFEHALDPAYRRAASWVFNDTTLKAIKSLLDGNNRPLWLPAATGSAGDKLNAPTLMNYGYVIDQGYDDVGTGNRPITFGDLSEFIIREVLGINLFRFNERYMDALQIGWLGYARWDSNLIDVNAVVTDIGVA